MLALIGTLLGWSFFRYSNRKDSAIRWLWTTSFLLFVVHVLSSFHFVHHWSHQQAYLATATETRKLMGVEFGAGVYFNYLFLLGWAIHVWFTWRPQLQENAWVRLLLRLIFVYMLFIAFNGVVVFKSGWLRALGVTATFAVISAVVWSLLRTKRGITKHGANLMSHPHLDRGAIDD